MKAVIFNADDFGARPETNAAIVRAHREGVLTSASLMVGEPAFGEAVRLARENPALSVGLHVALSDGVATLPRDEIPHLADARGRFAAHPAMAGLRAFLWRRETAREVAAQFERFAATGLPWSHVDGHQHLHLNPAVWDAVIAQCERHGVRRIRIPYEELPAGGVGMGAKVERAVFLALRRRCLRTLAGRGFTVAERVYGHLQTGRMTAEVVLDILRRLGGATNEIYLHPGAPHSSPQNWGAGEPDPELEALLSPRVRAEIDAQGLLLTTYPALGAAQRK